MKVERREMGNECKEKRVGGDGINWKERRKMGVVGGRERTGSMGNIEMWKRKRENEGEKDIESEEDALSRRVKRFRDHLGEWIGKEMNWKDW